MAYAICQEFDFYVRSFKVDMHGPLAYYKTHKLRYEEEKSTRDTSFVFLAHSYNHNIFQMPNSRLGCPRHCLRSLSVGLKMVRHGKAPIEV